MVRKRLPAIVCLLMGAVVGLAISVSLDWAGGLNAGPKLSDEDMKKELDALERRSQALAALLDCDVPGPVNIASGQAVSLQDLVGRIADALGRRQLLEIRREPGGADEPETISADVRRLRDEVGWSPRFDLETGLQQTIRWWSERSETDD